MRVLENFSTGRLENLADRARDPRLSLERVDISSEPWLESLFAGAEWIVHHAALADIVASMERPMDYHRANVDGTVAMLEVARHAGVGRFLYAAASSCYASPTPPAPETAPARAQYPYAHTVKLHEVGKELKHDVKRTHRAGGHVEICLVISRRLRILGVVRAGRA